MENQRKQPNNGNPQRLPKKLIPKDKKLRKEILAMDMAKKQSRRAIETFSMVTKELPGFLEADDGEDLLRVRQKDIANLIPIQNKNKIFDLSLNFGNYMIDYTRDGNYLLMAGSLGQIALMKWKEKNLVTEFNVKDRIRDVKFLQNERMFAVAQEKYTYIYDNNGIEVHSLRNHLNPLILEYLPYHYLLSSIGKAGYLNYQDISTGQIVATFKTKVKVPNALVQNPANAVLALGDNKGVATFWSPNSGTPLVKLLCHKGQINSIAFHNSGHYMTTLGSECAMKVWDLRMFKELFTYFNPRPVNHSDISQTGLLAISYGHEIQVWKDFHLEKQKKPYYKHTFANDQTLSDVKFAPYEDFLGVGKYGGFSSVIVPGAGDPNFDSMETNIFATKKQKKEAQVHKLMEKLPYDSITIDPNIIGSIDNASEGVKEAERKAEKEEEERRAAKNKKKKDKARGKSKADSDEKRRQMLADARQRLRLKDQFEAKFRLRQAEKKKVEQENNLLEAEDLLMNIDAFDIVRKKHRHE